MKILVTGCNGIVACAFAKYCDKQKYTIWGLSQHGLTNPYLSNEEYIQLDMTDFDALDETIRKLQPDIILHTAALTKPDACELDKTQNENINALVAMRLFDLANSKGIYLIHLSSDFVFSGKLDFHGENSTDFPPVNAYGNAKRAAEEYIEEHRFPFAVVRTSLVYGYEPKLPRGNIFTWLLEQLSASKAVRVVNDQFRSPTYADDLAQGLWKLCEKRESGIWHIAGKERLAVLDFALLVAEVFELDESLIQPVQTKQLNEPALRPSSTALQIEKARSGLGYGPSSVYENLLRIKKKMTQ